MVIFSNFLWPCDAWLTVLVFQTLWFFMPVALEFYLVCVNFSWCLNSYILYFNVTVFIRCIWIFHCSHNFFVIARWLAGSYYFLESNWWFVMCIALEIYVVFVTFSWKKKFLIWIFNKGLKFIVLNEYVSTYYFLFVCLRVQEK